MACLTASVVSMFTCVRTWKMARYWLWESAVKLDERDTLIYRMRSAVLASLTAISEPLLPPPYDVARSECQLAPHWRSLDIRDAAATTTCGHSMADSGRIVHHFIHPKKRVRTPNRYRGL